MIFGDRYKCNTNLIYKEQNPKPRGEVISNNYFQNYFFKVGVSPGEFTNLGSIFSLGQKSNKKLLWIVQLTLSLFKHEIKDICFSDERFYLFGKKVK